MNIEADKITMQIGWENEDFINLKHTIVCEYKNLRVKFKVDDDPSGIINEALKARLITFKALKRFKKALSIYPLGGNIRYNLQ